MPTRPISFAEAKRLYVHRFTMEHIPQWAKAPHHHGNGLWLYYAPQHATDLDWYNTTIFKGEGGMADRDHCYSTPSWPLGKGWLKEPFHLNREQKAIDAATAA